MPAGAPRRHGVRPGRTLDVEPVQQLAVVLGQPHDLARSPRLEGLGRARQLAVLGLLDVGVDRPAVRAAVGRPRRSLIRSTMSSVNVSPRRHRRARATRRPCPAHEVGEEALDQAVLAHDLSRPLDAGPVRIASFCSPRSTRPRPRGRFSISPAEGRETPSISATRGRSREPESGRHYPLSGRRGSRSSRGTRRRSVHGHRGQAEPSADARAEGCPDRLRGASTARMPRLEAARSRAVDPLGRAPEFVGTRVGLPCATPAGDRPWACLAFITLRFSVRYGASAVVALVHDAAVEGDEHLEPSLQATRPDEDAEPDRRADETGPLRAVGEEHRTSGLVGRVSLGIVAECDVLRSWVRALRTRSASSDRDWHRTRTTSAKGSADGVRPANRRARCARWRSASIGLASAQPHRGLPGRSSSMSSEAIPRGGFRFLLGLIGGGPRSS